VPGNDILDCRALPKWDAVPVYRRFRERAEWLPMAELHLKLGYA